MEAAYHHEPHYYRSNGSNNGNGHHHHHHHLQHMPQQHYHQLPVIVSNGSEATTRGAGAAIVVVDPPRPPFIPKKPVYAASNASGANNAQQQQSTAAQHIYAQANNTVASNGSSSRGIATFSSASSAASSASSSMTTYIGGANSTNHFEPQQRNGQQQQPGLHYSVSNAQSVGIYAATSVVPNNTSNGHKAKQQRRLSLVNGESILMKMPEARPPISSYGCSDAGRGKEGRIYATAGFGGNQRKMMQIEARNGNGLKSAGSHACLNGIGDGKSTLGRKAQRLAQKAANKLTIGSLGSELSSSASALYSLFTSSTENNGGGPTAAGRAEMAAIYAESHSHAPNNNHLFYWDKAPVVSAHTSRGIDFLERFGQFMKERAQIEEEYAAKLKALAKRSRGKKTEDEDLKLFTTMSAFQAMLNELESLASQHEVIGERLRGDLLPLVVDKCRQLRAGRKKHSQDFENMEKSLQLKVDELGKQKKNYEKAHLDAQGGYVKFAKAEKNLHLSRLDLEKAKQNMHNKSSICEQSKQSYAAQLATTNQAKYEHFNVALPHLLEEMRRLDVERIEFTRQAMLDSVKAETSVLSIIQRCYNDMSSVISTIDPERDTLSVVEQTKSGFAHPLDFQFEDLGDPALIMQDGAESFDGSTMKRQSGAGAKNLNGKAIPRKQSLKLFSTSTNGGKSNGTAHGGTPNGGEYGHLPPQQRCRKIQQKLEELGAELRIKEQSQEGMGRIHVAYTQNPKLGDPQEVAKQLSQNRREMDMLQEQIARFKALLLDAQSVLNQPLGGHHNSQSSGQLNATTNSSTMGSSIGCPSPGSSPRGSAGSVSRLNGQQGHHYGVGGAHLNGNGERGSSYSEASSISSADAASLGGGGGGINGTGVPPKVVHQQQQNPIANATQPASSSLSTSGISNSTTPNSSTNNSHQQMPHIDACSAEFYAECEPPIGADSASNQSDLVLGTAAALYPYDAAPDEVGGTTISMHEGDQLLLLERDVGDGWTRVRHVKSNNEGFVPSSYLNMTWFQ